jgi:hypothetical protein
LGGSGGQQFLEIGLKQVAAADQFTRCSFVTSEVVLTAFVSLLERAADPIFSLGFRARR